MVRYCLPFIMNEHKKIIFMYIVAKYCECLDIINKELKFTDQQICQDCIAQIKKQWGCESGRNTFIIMTN